MIIGNTSFNPAQTVNSFLKSMGLSLSSKEQVIAKVTTLALGAILVANSLPLASAHRGCWNLCTSRCGKPQNPCFNECMRQCQGY